MAFEKYKDNYSLASRVHRLAWMAAHTILIRPFALPLFSKWRNLIFRAFGAEIGANSKICASAEIWAPWNLKMGQHTCIGPHTVIYNPGIIELGNKVTISQYTYLCTATHDYQTKKNTLYAKPIKVDDYAWVAARAFVGPGVNIGEGAVVGATSSVYKDVAPWTVVGGNPAKYIKDRVMREG